MRGRSVEVVIPGDRSDGESGGRSGGDVEPRRRFGGGAGARGHGPLHTTPRPLACRSEEVHSGIYIYI